MLQSSRMLFLVIIMSAISIQGGVRIAGTVTTESGDPLSYANVTVVGTNVGTASSEDGTYTLDLPSSLNTGESITLTAGYIGYKSSEASVTLI